MNSDWQCVALAELCTDVSYGYTESAQDEPVGPKFLRITDIQNGVVNWSSVPYCAIDAKKIQNYLLRRGDIVIARTGNSTGENYAFDSTETAVFASYLIRYRVDEERVNPFFVWYQLRTEKWWSFVTGSKTGSAQAGANAQVLGKFDIILPPRPIQDRIAEQLQLIDNKIDLNRRINQTLEAMAQAIFKSWFVDFDPVKAKIAAIEQGQDPLRAAMRAISGKTDAELDQMPREHHDQLAATAALFPDAMEESELGEIPKGWRSEAIGCYFDLTMGQSPPGNTYNEMGEGMPFYQGRTDFGVRFPTERVYCTAPTRLAKKGDVLVSVRAPVGDINFAVSDCAIGRGVAAVRHEHLSFALYVLRHQEPAFKRFESDGTVFGSINKKQFESLPFVVAPDELVRRFQSLVGPLDEKIESNEWKMRNLAILRDTLLPKLLSGELSVSSMTDKATP